MKIQVEIDLVGEGDTDLTFGPAGFGTNYADAVVVQDGTGVLWRIRLNEQGELCVVPLSPALLGSRRPRVFVDGMTTTVVLPEVAEKRHFVYWYNEFGVMHWRCGADQGSEPPDQAAVAALTKQCRATTTELLMSAPGE